tara:strand:+ start:162 stop:365 length:204 start_codon:yes stop_codon:yes gene_type:complete
MIKKDNEYLAELWAEDKNEQYQSYLNKGTRRLIDEDGKLMLSTQVLSVVIAAIFVVILLVFSELDFI